MGELATAAGPSCVTGASGHVGSALVRALLARGRPVRALVWDEARSLEGLTVEEVEGDIRDPERLARAFDGANVVYHCAALVSLDPNDAPVLRAINVEGTRNVIEACRRARVRRLVHFGSVHAFRTPAPGEPMDESLPLDPDPRASAYDRTKAEASRLVLDAVADGLDAVVVHPTGVIGPWDFRRSPMGGFIRAVGRGRLPVVMDGAFDWVDVRDVAAGALRAAEHGAAGAQYLLAGSWASMRDLVEQIAALAGRQVPRVYLPGRLVGLAAAVASRLPVIGRAAQATYSSSMALQTGRPIRSTRAATELGYAARPLVETLRDTLAWHGLGNHGPLSPV